MQDNLADITKLIAVDTSNFVVKTKFTADINALDDKIDSVEKNPKCKWISYEDKFICLFTNCNI